PHFFASEHDVHSVARFGARSVQKDVHSGNVPVHKTSTGECVYCRVQIGAAQQQIHILRKADRCCVNTSDPIGDGVSPDDCVWNTSPIERPGGAQQSSAHVVHGAIHPFQCNGAGYHGHILPFI